jgi:hypothetical protein
MNRLIEQLGVADNFKISAILKVEELSNHDMIYIYHHLEPGKQLELKLKDSNLNGDPRYDVFYKEFHLGTVLVTGIMRSFYEGQNSLTAEIAGLSRDKYFPIKELDIRLGVNAMKKAS